MVTAMDDNNDAERVVLAFKNAINQYADPTILIHEVWVDTSHSACVLYEYVSSDLGVIGRRITFPPHAIEGNPESTGEDWAQNVREPLGSLVSTLKKDERGISWIGVHGGRFPSPPYGDQSQGR